MRQALSDFGVIMPQECDHRGGLSSFLRFEISDYLNDETVIAEYLLAAADDPDPEVLLCAEVDVLASRLRDLPG
jgi:hypothetical protein